MELEQKNIICLECHNAFAFSVGEQEFFKNRGLSHEPKRCPDCRVLMRMRRLGKSTALAARISCTACGQPATLPFQPKGDKPLYCSACFIQNRWSQQQPA